MADGQVGRQVGESEVGRRSHECTDQEQGAPGDDVGRPGHGQEERPRHEAELDGDGEHGQVQAGEPPLAGQERGDGRCAEPGGHRQELAGAEEREDPPAVDGIVRSASGSGALPA